MELFVKFESKFKELTEVSLPQFTGTRVMMMPILIGDLSSVPSQLDHYGSTLQQLFGLSDPKHYGKVGYITIDEKVVQAGSTHRRSGLHVDGVFNGSCGGWGGGGGSWGSKGNGMITVSSVAGCKAYQQELEGEFGKDGEADSFKSQLKEECATIFKPYVAYWVDGLCVHESLSMPENTARQFVRLSMPSKGPWFIGYTENPLGVLPTGEILDSRPYMSELKPGSNVVS
jgi:hypothetical protein